MVVVIARLRWTLRKRATITGVSARVTYLAAWGAAAVLGLLLGQGASQLSRLGWTLGNAALVLVCSVGLVAWVAAPLLLPGMADPGIDPARLQQFPVTARDQVLGLSLGALFGRRPLVAFLFLAGAAFSSGIPLAARLAIPVLGVGFAVLGVVASGAVLALLAQAMTSRRGQDVGIVLGAGLLIGAYLLVQRVGSIDIRALLSAADSSLLVPVLGWSPLGTFGAAAAAAAQGDWSGLAAHAAVGLATIVVLVAVWVWAIARQVNGSTGAGLVSDAARAGELVLVPAGLRWLGGGVVAASTAQMWRYVFFRSARAIQNVVLPLVAMVVVADYQVERVGLEFSALLIGIGGMMGAQGVFNYDGRGYVFLVAAAQDWTKILFGRLLALVILVVPILLAFVTAETAWREQPDKFLISLLIGFAAIALGFGVGAMTSVTAAISRVGELRKSPTRNARIAAAMLAPVGVFIAIIVLRTTVLKGVPDVALALLAFVVCCLLGWYLFHRASRRLTANPWAVAHDLMVL